MDSVLGFPEQVNPASLHHPGSPPPGAGPQGSNNASRGAEAVFCSARSSAWRPLGGTGGGHFFGPGWT
jgi:hypothetical protein